MLGFSHSLARSGLLDRMHVLGTLSRVGYFLLETHFGVWFSWMGGALLTSGFAVFVGLTLRIWVYVFFWCTLLRRVSVPSGVRCHDTDFYSRVAR